MLCGNRHRTWAVSTCLVFSLTSRLVVAEDREAAAEIVIGGIVRGEGGESIENVAIKFSWKGQDRGYLLDVKTGPDGRWQGRVPGSMHPDQLWLYHTDYVCVPISRSVPPEERLRALDSAITMKRGRHLRGTVRDSRGNPVANALVLTQPYNVDMDKPDDDLTTTRTRDDGKFAVRNMPEGRAWLAVYTDAYAPQVAAIDVGETTPTVEIELSPPSELSGQIVDDDGQPVSDVSIWTDDWNVGPQFPLQHPRARTDGEGRFRLVGLPHQGTFELNYSKAGFLHTMRRGVLARKEPYSLRMPHPTTFRGQVLDDRTGEPIKRFTVIQGRRWSHSDEMAFNHRWSKEVQADDGRFVASIDSFVALPPFPEVALRVVADGYVSAEAKPLAVGKKSDAIVFRLRPGEPITGVVIDPKGQSAPNAQLAWVGPKRKAFIQHGRFMKQFTYGPEEFAEADADGHFQLPATRDDGLIVALHESGYALRRLSQHEANSALRLTAWARVEGRVRNGRELIGDINVSLNPLDPKARDEVSFYLSQQTHVDGSFAMDFVPPIPLSIAYYRAHLASHKTLVTPKPGETAHVEIGGTGRAVAGRLKKPSGLKMPSFTDGFEVGLYLTQIAAFPAAEADRKREDRTNYVAQLEPDGSFVIPDLPPGSYRWEVNVHAPVPPESCGLPVNVAEARGEFEVPSEPSDAPIELGAVDLASVTGPQEGQMPPALVGKTLTGESFDLARLRGKLVLLDFWATWCGPCKAATPALKQLYETYGRDGRVAFVGVNIDHAAETAAGYVASEGVAWPQLATGSWGEENAVLREFAVTSAPSFWIIGSDGVIIARDLPIADLAGRIETALRTSTVPLRTDNGKK